MEQTEEYQKQEEEQRKELDYTRLIDKGIEDFQLWIERFENDEDELHTEALY